MSTAIETIISKLPQMSISELNQVRQMTDILLGTSKEQKIENEDEYELFEAAKAGLAASGIRYQISYQSFSETKYYKAWKKGFNTVVEFVNTSFRGFIKKKAQKVGLYRILIKSLIIELSSRGIPVSLNTIAMNLHRIPQVFDRAFPDYLKSGIAFLVPQAMLKIRTA